MRSAWGVDVPSAEDDPIVLGADEGRRYAMGNLSAIFKADGAETGGRYAVSEWIVDAGFTGVGPHSHDENEELFHVLDGDVEILIGEIWTAVARGTFVRIPARTMHDFRNPHSSGARLLNIFMPGGFEQQIPGIVAWFESNATGGDN